MLFATSLGNPGLSGGGAIEDLQNSLVSLSQVARWPAVNPGQVTGYVTPQTVSAVSAVVGNLAGLDGTISKAIKAAVLVASVNATAMSAAQNLITGYAGYLAAAVKVLAAKYQSSAPAPPLPPAPPPPGYPGYAQPYYAPPPGAMAPAQPFFRKNNPAVWISAAGALLIVALLLKGKKANA